MKRYISADENFELDLDKWDSEGFFPIAPTAEIAQTAGYLKDSIKDALQETCEEVLNIDVNKVLTPEVLQSIDKFSKDIGDIVYKVYTETNKK